jgi:hypothetical protein
LMFALVRILWHAYGELGVIMLLCYCGTIRIVAGKTMCIVYRTSIIIPNSP